MTGSEFGKWLAYQLKRRGWSQADLAKETGASTGSISRWINGSRTPDPPWCDRIADVFGVDVDAVLTLAGHRPHIDEPDPNDRVAVIASTLRRMKLDDQEMMGLETFLGVWLDQLRDSRKRRGAG